MRRLAAGLVLAALGSPAASGPASAAGPTPEEHRREVEAWRTGRIERLLSETGWVTLAGLSWLVEGENRLGADPESEVPLPSGKAAPHAGTIRYDGERAKLTAAPGVEITHDGRPVAALELRSDAEEGTTTLELGDLLFYPIRRGERLGIRVKDRQHPKRFDFPGIQSFPVDLGWRLPARFEPHPEGTTIPVPNILGTIEDTPSWGRVAFEVGGETFRLDAVAEPGDEELFLIFADATTGEATYGGGRYLYAAAPDASGTVVLDFNKAYNPPCVFTPYATCPLPPRQNRLPIAIEAGEKITGLERFTGH